MDWIPFALALPVGIGLVLITIASGCRRAVFARTQPPPPPRFPAISVLKPLKGADAGLADNLRSLFRQDYPDFELLFGVDAADDPALPVARRIAAEFPRVTASFHVGEAAFGHNPKVRNLGNLFSSARHDLILINDSNVSAPPDHLRRLAARGVGGVLEALHLHGFVLNGMCAVHHLLGIPTAIGKSMILRRSVLARIGGFSHLSRYLAEDHVSAEAVAALGLRVELETGLVDNVLGDRSIREFAERHLRWSRIRRHVGLAGYAGEIVMNPVLLALLGVALHPSHATGAVLAGALSVQCLLDAAAERAVGVRRRWWVYPAAELLLAVIKGVLWPVPFFSDTVTWRGNPLRIAGRTRLISLPSAARSAAAPAIPERLRPVPTASVGLDIRRRAV